MKVCTILLISAICLLGTNASKAPFKMPEKLLQKSKAAGDKCIKEVGAPSDFMEHLFPWNYPKNELNEKTLFCFVTTLGLANQDGIFSGEKVLSVFTSSDKIEEIKKAFTDCNEMRGNNPQETAFIISECFFDKAPIRLMM
ncbi:uncharacterized protein LOC106714404 [Papilio machaon]|uniref:uncharacterized protein LOC106714404 n=1 Tax=Papilio machaon TaxID=76193 RepID=UPI001E6641F7|nr:uncharacterized protein LOC106714404 [Papilio machaon]